MNPEEGLTYELIVENGKDDLVKILSIDKITGNISIKTDYSTVGSTNFSVKATDSEGCQLFNLQLLMYWMLMIVRSLQKIYPISKIL